MEFRNVKKVSDTEITCEVNHPEYGWIPYTAIANSGEEQMEKIWKAATKKKKLAVDIDVIKNRAFFDLKSATADKVHLLTDKYTDDEVKLWDLKRKEAEIALAGGTSDILQTEADLSEETIQEIATKVIKYNDAYRKTVITSEATKRNIEKDFAKVTTEKEVNDFLAKYKKVLGYD